MGKFQKKTIKQSELVKELLFLSKEMAFAKASIKTARKKFGSTYSDYAIGRAEDLIFSVNEGFNLIGLGYYAPAGEQQEPVSKYTGWTKPAILGNHEKLASAMKLI